MQHRDQGPIYSVFDFNVTSKEGRHESWKWSLAQTHSEDPDLHGWRKTNITNLPLLKSNLGEPKTTPRSATMPANKCITKPRTFNSNPYWENRIGNTTHKIQVATREANRKDSKTTKPHDATTETRKPLGACAHSNRANQLKHRITSGRHWGPEHLATLHRNVIQILHHNTSIPKPCYVAPLYTHHPTSTLEVCIHTTHKSTTKSLP